MHAEEVIAKISKVETMPGMVEEGTLMELKLCHYSENKYKGNMQVLVVFWNYRFSM